MASRSSSDESGAVDVDQGDVGEADGGRADVLQLDEAVGVGADLVVVTR